MSNQETKNLNLKYNLSHCETDIYQQNLYNSIYNMICENPMLMSIVKKYSFSLKSNIQNASDYIYFEMKPLIEPSKKIARDYLQAFENLDDIGFDTKLDTNGQPDGYFYTTDTIYNKFLLLDGFYVSPKTILAGKNPFSIELEKIKKKNPSYKITYENFINKIRELEKNKLALKFSKSKQEELQRLYKEFEEIKDVYINATKLEECAQKFDSLTSTQKQKLITFYQVQADFAEVSDKILDFQFKMSALNGKHSKSSAQEIIEQCIETTMSKMKPHERAYFENIPYTITLALSNLSDSEFTDLATRQEHSANPEKFDTTDEIIRILTNLTLKEIIAQVHENTQENQDGSESEHNDEENFHNPNQIPFDDVVIRDMD